MQHFFLHFPNLVCLYKSILCAHTKGACISVHDVIIVLCRFCVGHRRHRRLVKQPIKCRMHKSRPPPRSIRIKDTPPPWFLRETFSLGLQILYGYKECKIHDLFCWLHIINVCGCGIDIFCPYSTASHTQWKSEVIHTYTFQHDIYKNFPLAGLLIWLGYRAAAAWSLVY